MKFFSFILSLLEYILIIGIILDCNTPYASAINKNYHLTEINILCIVALLFINILIYKIKINTFKRWILIFIPYYFLMILYLFISVDDIKYINFISRFLIAIPFLTIIFCIYNQRGKLFTLLNKFSKVMFLLSVVSLFFWFFGSQLHLISPSGTLKAFWGIEFNYPSYYGLYFERQTDNFLWITGFRNIGIFSEGPMFSLCLIFSLYIEMFLNEVKSNKVLYKEKNNLYLRFNNKITIKYIRLLIFIVTLFTTTTTTGMIIFILMIIMKFSFLNSKNKIMRVIKWILAFIVIIVGVLAINALFINKASSNSWLIRVEDFRIGVKAWMNSPIFGNGYGEWTALENLMISSSRTNTGFSNTVFTVLSQGGVILFIIYLIPIVGYFRYSIKMKDGKILILGCIFFIEFVVTLFQYTFLMMLFLSLGYALIINDKILYNKYKINKNKKN